VHHSDGIARITQDRIDDLHRARRWANRRSTSRDSIE
jgi:hypothetical protein